MTMKLYYVPRTRASRPRWLLEELGVPYELVRLDLSKGETKSDEHTARHPLQHVPVLETRDGSIFESAAIVLHLADLYPDRKLIGAPGTHARALAYQWLFFAMTELEPPAVTFFTHFRAKNTEHPDAFKAKDKLALALKPLERHFASKEWLIDGGFSVADLVVGAVLSWCAGMGMIADSPNVLAWVERLRARPAFKAAHRD
ncbi:MAG: glutathione S-transferase family protein [Myxococcota bacterium]